MSEIAPTAAPGFIGKPVLLVMGVSGAGKSTIGAALAVRLGCAFQEGDLLHRPESIRKMANGIPLTDADRWPWLERCRLWIDQSVRSGGGGVLACSALKRDYRDCLLKGHREQVRLVYLRADAGMLAHRLELRVGHYMPKSLLQSQIETLEPPSASENPITIDAGAPIEDAVGHVVGSLHEA